MGKLKINKNSKFFHDRADELRQLEKSLSSLYPVGVAYLEPLKIAAKQLDILADGNTTLNQWGYQINNLTLPVGNIHNVNPDGIQAKICVNCECEFNVDDWNKTDCDPFNKCSFRVRVFGEIKGIKHSWGMHLDKETKQDLDEWHPLYHLHCFESRVDAPTVLVDDEQKKGTLLLNVPRLMHYPLDIVLGVGFCLMNFNKKELFTKLYTNDQQFPRLYKKSQDRILKPYFDSLAGVPGCVYPKKALCPQIV